MTANPSRWKVWARRLLVLWVVSNVVALPWHWQFDREKDHEWNCRNCGATLHRTPDGQLYYDGANRSYIHEFGSGRGHTWNQVEPRTRFALWQPWNWLSDLLIRPYNPNAVEVEAKKLPHNWGLM